MSIEPWLLDSLCDPLTLEKLRLQGNVLTRADGRQYPLVDETPSLVYPAHLMIGKAAMAHRRPLMKLFYDWRDRTRGRLLLGQNM